MARIQYRDVDRRARIRGGAVKPCATPTTKALQRRAWPRLSWPTTLLLTWHRWGPLALRLLG